MQIFKTNKTSKNKKDDKEKVVGTIVDRIPWKNASLASDIPLTLNYDFNGSMYDAVEAIAKKYPNAIAFEFMGRRTTYKRMIEKIHKCAKSLKVLGVRENDCVTIALPNCPQAIYTFYAINLIGGIANVIHPLSAEKEIEYYLNNSKSVTAITLDSFYHKFEKVRANTKLNNIVIASIKDELSKPIKTGYMITETLTLKRIPRSAPVIRWRQFMRLSRFCFFNYKVEKLGKAPAVMLYSGGTTGTSKGIVLTNYNFNFLGAQTMATNPMFRPGDKMLAAMPLFHGFGLGICVHFTLSQGLRCVLIPRVNQKTFAKTIIKTKCNIIAGVPTLLEALLRSKRVNHSDLSFLKGVFSGGDTLPIDLKIRFDNFLKQHGATIQIREGYGTTESVNMCCLTPPNIYKEGSIGIPCPDMYMKIVRPGSDKELPYGTVGEILVAGPTIMKRYWDNPKETEETLIPSKTDGLTWLHTGDLGYMDNDGYIYFKGRAKRMIITSGYNVYPAQLESIFNAHTYVKQSCMIGVPDSYKMKKIKAFVVLSDGIEKSQTTKDELMVYAKKHLAKYEMPYDIEFIDSMPKTMVGKVDYRKLENDELEKIKDAN